MLKKLCPYCLKSSFSAYDNPQWICPYCGKNIGFSKSRPINHKDTLEIEEKKITSIIIRLLR